MHPFLFPNHLLLSCTVPPPSNTDKEVRVARFCRVTFEGVWSPGTMKHISGEKAKVWTEGEAKEGAADREKKKRVDELSKSLKENEKYKEKKRAFEKQINAIKAKIQVKGQHFPQRKGLSIIQPLITWQLLPCLREKRAFEEQINAIKAEIQVKGQHALGIGCSWMLDS